MLLPHHRCVAVARLKRRSTTHTFRQPFYPHHHPPSNQHDSVRKIPPHSKVAAAAAASASSSSSSSVVVSRSYSHFHITLKLQWCEVVCVPQDSNIAMSAVSLIGVISTLAVASPVPNGEVRSHRYRPILISAMLQVSRSWVDLKHCSNLRHILSVLEE